MKAILNFLPEARVEFDAAADWYESEEKGLGVDFIARVRAVFSRITSNPRIHQKVFKDVRRAVVKRFPYVVLYQETAAEVLVIPMEWQRRIA